MDTPCNTIKYDHLTLYTGVLGEREEERQGGREGGSEGGREAGREEGRALQLSHTCDCWTTPTGSCLTVIELWERKDIFS